MKKKKKIYEMTFWRKWCSIENPAKILEARSKPSKLCIK